MPEPLNVWSLRSGQALRVVKTFKDGGGNTVEAGTILHFEKRDFLPYHSGHTVYFKEVTLYLCDLDDTGEIVENAGREFYEEYPPLVEKPRKAKPKAPVPPPPLPPPAPKAVEPPPPPSPPPPPMPHMRFGDMFMNLRVVVVQPFQSSTGHAIAADGVEMQFLQFNGTAFCFLRGSICLDPGDPILENAGNAWLYPLPTLDSLYSCLEHLWNHGLTPLSEAVQQCQKWLNQPAPRPKPPELSSENLPFAEAFLIEGLKHA